MEAGHEVGAAEEEGTQIQRLVLRLPTRFQMTGSTEQMADVPLLEIDSFGVCLLHRSQSFRKSRSWIDRFSTLRPSGEGKRLSSIFFLSTQQFYGIKVSMIGNPRYFRRLQ